jgi:dephospho-CoA kinase
MKPVDCLVIDGVRNVEEIETFKRELADDFIVVAVEVSDKTRHKRAMSRKREDDSLDIVKIKERDRREIGWGLNAVIASADIVISNEVNINDFKEEIKKLLLEKIQN